jgi:hypothetical protein
MKICLVGAELFYVDGQTDITKLIATFSNSTKAPKKRDCGTESTATHGVYTALIHQPFSFSCNPLFT